MDKICVQSVEADISRSRTEQRKSIYLNARARIGCVALIELSKVKRIDYTSGKSHALRSCDSNRIIVLIRSRIESRAQCQIDRCIVIGNPIAASAIIRDVEDL